MCYFINSQFIFHKFVFFHICMTEVDFPSNCLPGAVMLYFYCYFSRHNSKRDIGSRLMLQQMGKVCLNISWLVSHASKLLLLTLSTVTSFCSVFFKRVKDNLPLRGSPLFYVDGGSTTPEDTPANEWDTLINRRIFEDHWLLFWYLNR